jgi:2-phospho-L-lactate guanylyltransferase (CobY/MobA/RfbA family)
MTGNERTNKTDMLLRLRAICGLTCSNLATATVMCKKLSGISTSFMFLWTRLSRSRSAGLQVEIYELGLRTTWVGASIDAKSAFLLKKETEKVRMVATWKLSYSRENVSLTLA